MVGVVTREVKDIPKLEQASNAALIGALVLHMFAGTNRIDLPASLADGLSSDRFFPGGVLSRQL